MNVTAIVQARMNSSRLPGKVLKILQNHTVLTWVVKRLQRSLQLKQIIIATTQNKVDDAIALHAQELGVLAYRGSEEDVLQRFFEASKFYEADIIVRICSDCPLIDVQLIDSMLDQFVKSNKTMRVDYLSNTIDRSYPRGLDCEIFSFSALERSHHEAILMEEREHVTPYIYRNPQKFVIEQFKSLTNCSHFRWTLDTDADWEFLQTLVARCASKNKIFINSEELITCLGQNPDIVKINQHIRQKELQV